MYRLSIILVVVGLIAACGERPAIGDQTYPWQIKITEKGNSKVFGIEIDAMPLGHSARVLGKQYEVGLFENKKGVLSLEAYFNELARGGLSGKLIVILGADRNTLVGFKARSLKQKRQESGEIKYTLSQEDKKHSEKLIVTGLSYIPYVQLDKETIEKRFGIPDNVITTEDKLKHYIYASKGLEIIQDDEGKELLQYVSPENIQRLLKPLNRMLNQ